MGCSSSKLSRNKVKNSIDAQLELSAYQDKLKFKILLLGSGECGKSTVMKGIKIINKILPSQQELMDVANSLRRNVVQCMMVLIEQLPLMGLEITDGSLKAQIETVRRIDDADESFTVQVADAILSLWKSPIIKQVWAKRKEFWILDSAEYYFNNVERFADEEFVPTEEDMVMARVMTTGIITTDVKTGPLFFSVVDVGGQRNERRKWINVFSDVHMIVYVVNLAGYNAVLFEDQTQNRMSECLALFKQTVNNPLFAQTPIFLIFNKKDLFESKIREDPITSCPDFLDYTGGSDLHSCLNYVDQKFKGQITSGSADRVKIFHIAARFKKDIKEVWDELAAFLRTSYKKDIEAAMKYLEKNSIQPGPEPKPST